MGNSQHSAPAPTAPLAQQPPHRTDPIDPILVASNQQLETIPRPSHDQIEIIYADFNKIRELPADFSSIFPALIECYMAANLVERLPSSLVLPATLTVLNLGANNLGRSTPVDISALASLRELKELCLSSNGFTSATFPSLLGSPTLDTLSVGDNDLLDSDLLATKLPAALLSLDLSGNPCREPAALFGLGERLQSLRALNLNECQLTNECLAPFLALQQLSSFSLATNLLRGALPIDPETTWPDMTRFDASFNQLDEPLPLAFTARLKRFDFRGNPCVIAAPIARPDYPLAARREDNEAGDDHVASASEARQINEQLRTQIADLAPFFTSPDFLRPNHSRPDYPLADLILGDGLFLGDWPSACNLSALQALGITHIVCVAQFPKPFARHLDYHCIFVRDADDEPLIDHFPSACDYIDGCLRQRTRVLVHCRAGVSRSASIVTAYVMRRFRLTAVEALALIKLNRSCVCPNNGFFEQLNQWATQLGLATSSRP